MRLFLPIISIVLISCNSENVTTDSGSVKTTLISESIGYIDSTFLVIKLHKTEYSISIRNDSVVTPNVSTVDSFLSKQIGLIQKDKMVVIRSKNNIERFNNLKDILKKYELNKFRIETDESLE